jgi:hypothetical protein
MAHSKTIVRNSLTQHGYVATPLARLAHNHSVHNALNHQETRAHDSDEDAVLIQSDDPTLANALPLPPTEANADADTYNNNNNNNNNNIIINNNTASVCRSDSGIDATCHVPAENTGQNQTQTQTQTSADGHGTDNLSPAQTSMHTSLNHSENSESNRSDKNQIVPKISENVGVSSSDAPEAKSVLDKVFGE